PDDSQPLSQRTRGRLVPGRATEPGRLVPDPPSPAGAGARAQARAVRRPRPGGGAGHRHRQDSRDRAAGAGVGGTALDRDRGIRTRHHAPEIPAGAVGRAPGAARAACDPIEKALMSTEIRVPQLPESVADATLVAWHKQPGDAIRRDENLADLETDKVVLEVPAPANGVVREIRVRSGTVVKSGQVLAVIEEGAAAAAAAKPAAPEAPAPRSAPAAKASAPAAKPAPAVTLPAATDAGKDAGKLRPSVRRLVEENHLDPAVIAGSGRDGRLTKSDVVDYLGKKAPQAASAAPAPTPAAR